MTDFNSLAALQSWGQRLWQLRVCGQAFRSSAVLRCNTEMCGFPLLWGLARRGELSSSGGVLLAGVDLHRRHKPNSFFGSWKMQCVCDLLRKYFEIPMLMFVGLYLHR